MCYTQRYAAVLETGDATTLVQASPAVRRHAMESLAAWSKFNGSYDRWKQIRESFSLRWTSGNESLQSLERFFNPEMSLDHMIDRVKQMLHVLPADMVTVVKHSVLTGLRPTEACESVRLLNVS
jgi:hypothetical protein